MRGPPNCFHAADVVPKAEVGRLGTILPVSRGRPGDTMVRYTAFINWIEKRHSALDPLCVMQLPYVEDSHNGEGHTISERKYGRRYA